MLPKFSQNCWVASATHLRCVALVSGRSKCQNIFGTFQIECEKFWTFWKFFIFHEKIMKIMKTLWKSCKIMKNLNIFENFSKISEKSWKIKNFQKVQNFSHSIWKVPKTFCHYKMIVSQTYNVPDPLRTIEISGDRRRECSLQGLSWLSSECISVVFGLNFPPLFADPPKTRGGGVKEGGGGS